MGTWRHWIYGLIAAFVGGGAGAVSAGFSAAVIDPDHFNMGSGLNHTFELMGVTFVVSGLLAAMAYLKQSPLPRELWSDAERIAQANGK